MHMYNGRATQSADWRFAHIIEITDSALHPIVLWCASKENTDMVIEL